MTIIINNQEYNVSKNEFVITKHNEFSNLNILQNLGYYERIISLITTISQSCNISTSVFHNTTHGGFIPLQCASHFQQVILINTQNEHKKNILANATRHHITNLDFAVPKNTDVANTTVIHFSENVLYIPFIETNTDFLLTTHSDTLAKLYKHVFHLSTSDFYIYVPDHLYDQWYSRFHYYLENLEKSKTVSSIPTLAYDNLINLCIMVKNAGSQFEDMLKSNIHLIDEWTILDTGSTDETIDIIQRVLVGKKRGTLYQEPFINFRNSRNRLLDLAGKSCKYTLMLDDTYVIQGNLREFLETVRGDQFSTSFSLYIKSDDVEYASNRVLKSECGLKYLYKIHEVIQYENNVNVIIPIQIAHIFDGRFEYMEERTMERKKLDLKLLFEELQEDPNNSRTHYYLGQTYNLLKDYENAYRYFLERANHPNEGFLQEKIDAIFEAARAANFKLNCPWSECEVLYERAYELDKTRPDSIYFLGIHYYLEGGSKNRKKAYEYFKLGFEIGYPLHCQYSLKPTLSFHFLPKFLTQLCYEYENYELGEKCAKLFLDNNLPNMDMYLVIESWYKIFVYMNQYIRIDEKTTILRLDKNDKPILCFVADGGFAPWSGSSILSTGVGGSETYIIEMARHIQKHGFFQVIVFCNCEKPEIFEGVYYYHLKQYFEFIKYTHVHTAIISRYTEYYPATTLSTVNNIYMVAHDLTLSGMVFPIHPKLRKIFCLTEWHVSYYETIFPILKAYFVPFYYGINPLFELTEETAIKEKNSFIYSSYATRGLLQLLQMWPKITDAYPDASLHIYTDVEGEWVNRVEPEMMKEIKSILFESASTCPLLNVQYHGWVDKSTLANAWKRAEYWLYPCIFMETFCLTALEAAITKTVAITNDLAALQNTVADRGLVIQGNARTSEWQTNAIKQILALMSSETVKQDYIRRNYEWAANFTWENQATKLLNDYLVFKQLQYVGMQNWTHDLPIGQQSKQRFVSAIQIFNQTCQISKPRILEVGTYTGTSLIEIVSRIPNSYGTGVDQWEDYNEDNIDILKTIKQNQIERVFHENVKIVGMENRIRGIKGDSADILTDYIRKGEVFDFIYVDGSHKCLDVYLDLILAWNILAPKGILAIDDYMYHYNRIDKMPYEYPFEGVNHFLKKYESKYTLLDKDYRVFIQKH